MQSGKTLDWVGELDINIWNKKNKKVSVPPTWSIENWWWIREIFILPFSSSFNFLWQNSLKLDVYLHTQPVHSIGAGPATWPAAAGGDTGQNRRVVVEIANIPINHWPLEERCWKPKTFVAVYIVCMCPRVSVATSGVGTSLSASYRPQIFLLPRRTMQPDPATSARHWHTAHENAIYTQRFVCWLHSGHNHQDIRDRN